MSEMIHFPNENVLRQKSTAYLLLVVMGTLGAHRYYLGNWASGLLMTLLGVVTAYALYTATSVWHYLAFVLIAWCLLDLAYIHHAVNTRRRMAYDFKPPLRVY